MATFRASTKVRAERVRRQTDLNERRSKCVPFTDPRRRGLCPWQIVSAMLAEHELGFVRHRLLTRWIDEEVFKQYFCGLNWPRDGPSELNKTT